MYTIVYGNYYLTYKILATDSSTFLNIHFISTAEIDFIIFISDKNIDVTSSCSLCKLYTCGTICFSSEGSDSQLGLKQRGLRQQHREI